LLTINFAYTTLGDCYDRFIIRLFEVKQAILVENRRESGEFLLRKKRTKTESWVGPQEHPIREGEGEETAPTRETD
jgi:NADH:ubiquinone oxidoreductase subunit D